MKKILKTLLIIVFIIPFNVFAIEKQYDLTNKYGIKVTTSTDYETIIKDYDNYTECDKLGIDEDKVIEYMDNLNAYVLITTQDLQKNILFTRDQDEYTKEYYNLTNIDEDVVNALAEGYSKATNNYYNIEKINNITYMIFKYDLISASDEHLYYYMYKTYYNGYDYTFYIQKYNEITAEDELELKDIVSKVEIPEIKNNTEDMYEINKILFLLLIGVPLTAICYMIVPFILVVILKKKYDSKSVKKMAFWNSLCVGILFLILTTALYGSGYWSAAPAFLYYLINKSIWVKKNKKEIESTEEDEEEIEELDI